jgi:hypothetical protein
LKYPSSKDAQTDSLGTEESESSQDLQDSLKAVNGSKLVYKVGFLEKATPQDLNTMILCAYQICEHNGEDMREIGDKLFSFIFPPKKAKQQILSKEPVGMFSKYLRRVFAFGHW